MAILVFTLASCATSGGNAGSLARIFAKAPGKLPSAHVLVSPIPITKLAWHEYLIGSSASIPAAKLITGNPSLCAVVAAEI